MSTAGTVGDSLVGMSHYYSYSFYHDFELLDNRLATTPNTSSAGLHFQSRRNLLYWICPEVRQTLV